MTPGARVAAAIGVLDAWLSGESIDRALTGWARGARYAGSKDRAAVRDLVFDAVRRKGNCAAFGGETGRGLMLGHLRLQGQPPEALFTGEGYAPAPLSATEQTPPAVAHDPWRDVPGWLRPTLRADLDADADPIVEAMQHRAPLYLRVNERKANVELVEESLVKDGIKTTKTDLAGALAVVENARRLRQSTAYLTGLVEIQDLSVQIACAAVGWPPSGRILDFCAGGGGKTLAIADRSAASLFAHDAVPVRMTDLPARAARAGISCTLLATDDLPRHAPFDAVLCDVPCSGSGTWRRDPEAKWRLTPDRLAELGQLQRQIVTDAARLVAPGGRFVYMTCSLLRAENEAVIEDTLLARGWTLLQTRRYTPLDASDGFFLTEMQHSGQIATGP